jgi:hypothetical protein
MRFCVVMIGKTRGRIGCGVFGKAEGKGRGESEGTRGWWKIGRRQSGSTPMVKIPEDIFGSPVSKALGAQVKILKPGIA